MPDFLTSLLTRSLDVPVGRAAARASAPGMFPDSLPRIQPRLSSQFEPGLEISEASVQVESDSSAPALSSDREVGTPFTARPLLSDPAVVDRGTSFTTPLPVPAQPTDVAPAAGRPPLTPPLTFRELLTVMRDADRSAPSQPEFRSERQDSQEASSILPPMPRLPSQPDPFQREQPALPSAPSIPPIAADPSKPASPQREHDNGSPRQVSITQEAANRVSDPIRPIIPTHIAAVPRLPAASNIEMPVADTQPPTIRVTIGRVEVRAMMPPAPPPARPSSSRPAAPAMSLDDYLRRVGNE